MNKLKRHKQIRVFEGFAGYGGATYGLQRAGINHKVVGYSEFDKFASELDDMKNNIEAFQNEESFMKAFEQEGEKIFGITDMGTTEN